MTREVGATQKVGAKGQVVIPKAVRDRLGLRPGDHVVITADDRGAIIQPATATKSLCGRLAGRRLVDVLEADRRTEPR